MIEGEIRAALESVPGCRIGLYARSLEGPQAGREIGFSEDEPLPSASLIKLLILAELLRRADAGLPLSRTIEAGEPDLVDGSKSVSELDLPSRPTLRWLAKAMITTSDNTATNLLVDLLGLPEINALADSLKLAHTRLSRHMMDFHARARGVENLTSARDAAALLAELYSGDSLSAHSRRLALDLLLSQRQPPGLPMNFPDDSRPAYKPADLDDARNCAALALLPGRTFAVAVLLNGDTASAYPAVDTVTSQVCKHFHGLRSPGPV